MNTSTETISKKALDCFLHGIAHLIDEQGKVRGLETARMALTIIEEEVEEPALTSNLATSSRSGS